MGMSTPIAPIRHLHELLRTKQVSQVELTKMYLDRLHKYAVAVFHSYFVSSVSQFTTTSKYALAAAPENGTRTRSRFPSGDNCQRWLSLL